MKQYLIFSVFSLSVNLCASQGVGGLLLCTKNKKEQKTVLVLDDAKHIDLAFKSTPSVQEEVTELSLLGQDDHASEELNHLLILMQRQAELQESVVTADLKKVKELLAQDCPVNTKAADQLNLLQVAIELPNYKMLKALLDACANPNACSDDGFTALHDAVIANRYNMVELLIECGADVLATLPDGTTALHMAAHYGYSRIAELLLQEGIPTNVTANYNVTPLFRAVVAGQYEMVDLLLRHGAQVNYRVGWYPPAKKDQWSNQRSNRLVKLTPLHMAVFTGNTDIIELLIDAGAKVDSTCSKGLTPIDYAKRLSSDNGMMLTKNIRSVEDFSDASAMLANLSNLKN